MEKIVTKFPLCTEGNRKSDTLSVPYGCPETIQLEHLQDTLNDGDNQTIVLLSKND